MTHGQYVNRVWNWLMEEKAVPVVHKKKKTGYFTRELVIGKIGDELGTTNQGRQEIIIANLNIKAWEYIRLIRLDSTSVMTFYVQYLNKDNFAVKQGEGGHRYLAATLVSKS